MAMEEGLDTGPVLLEESLAVGLCENASQLGSRLAELSAKLLPEALVRIAAVGGGSEADRLRRLGVRPQGMEGITHARPLLKDDYRIDWTANALAVHRRIMGLHPGAWCQHRGLRLRVLASEPLVERLREQLSPEAARLAERWGGAQQAAAGTVLALEEGVGVVIATGGCPLLLREAQLEGRRAAAGQALLQQLALKPGDHLEP
jgi:methionyl-tRNA formyltransferase